MNISQLPAKINKKIPGEIKRPGIFVNKSLDIPA